MPPLASLRSGTFARIITLGRLDAITAPLVGGGVTSLEVLHEFGKPKGDAGCDSADEDGLNCRL